MEIQQAQKIDVLLCLYRLVQGEITRYRDLEWKIPSWTVAVMGGIAAATRLVPIPVAHTPYVQTLLCVFTVTACIYAIWHIYFVHARLNEQRILRRRLDDAFGFFERGAYTTDSVYPEEWKTQEVPFTRGMAHLVSWIGIVVSAAIYAFYCVTLINYSGPPIAS